MSIEDANKIANDFYKKLSKLLDESNDQHFGLHTVVLIDALAHIIAVLDKNGDMKKEVLTTLEDKIDLYKS